MNRLKQIGTEHLFNSTSLSQTLLNDCLEYCHGIMESCNMIEVNENVFQKVNIIHIDSGGI